MRICFAVVFFCFLFCFFFRPPKLWENRSRERLNEFSWNFHQMIGGKCSLKRRAAAWRMSCRRLANVDDLLWDNRSRERLNRFSWNFHQTIGRKCSLKRRATAWRMSCRRLANGECWCFAYFTLWLFRNHQRAPPAVALYNNERANWRNLVSTVFMAPHYSRLLWFLL